MRRLAASFKRHMVEYYLFFLLAHGLLLPVWLELIRMFLIKNIEAASSLLFFTMGSLLLLLAGGVRHYATKWRLLSGILLSAGLIVEGFFAAGMLKTLLYDRAATVPAVISILVSVMWVLVYFLNVSDDDRERNKHVGKKIARYFVLTAALLYGPYFLLARYHRDQIDRILAAGSGGNLGSMQQRQIGMMIDEKMWQMEIMVSVLMICALMVLFCCYRRVKDRVVAKDMDGAAQP